MRIGLSYDLKDSMIREQGDPDDALEEYDSLETVSLISDALEGRGHSIVRLGGGTTFMENIRHQDVDIVFNIAEGRGNYRSREAQIPAILEMLDIPYTGSDPECLAVCLDKPLTKKLVSLEGIVTPKWLTITNRSQIHETSWQDFRFPVIVKPVWEGSSKGIRATSLAHNVEQVKDEASKIIEWYQQPVMVEEFIDGDEVTVGIIGNNPPKVLGTMRVVPRKETDHFIYSLEVKRDYTNLVDYECPANMPDDVIARLETASLKVFEAMGCRDFSRVDFRVSRDGIPYFIEINPLPGLGSYSDIIIMAKILGMKHEQVVNTVLDSALERYPKCISASL